MSQNNNSSPSAREIRLKSRRERNSPTIKMDSPVQRRRSLPRKSLEASSVVNPGNRKSREDDNGKNIVDDDFVDDIDVDVKMKRSKYEVCGVLEQNQLSSQENGCTFYVPANLETVTDHWTATTRYDIVKLLKHNLTKVQLALFKQTCFGYFLDLPEVFGQYQLIHHLMLREIISDRPNEFTIMLDGTRLCFGLQEYAVITGLNCFGDDIIVVDPAPNRIISSYFPNQEKVRRSELIKCFLGRRWISDEKAVKIVVLYFLHVFVLSTDSDINIPKEHFYLVESGAYFQ